MFFPRTTCFATRFLRDKMLQRDLWLQIADGFMVMDVFSQLRILGAHFFPKDFGLVIL